ncbi:hypothetical protein BaRGS_00006513 [Batillaria attramentaria]|uniref:Uncharacterized protein n=1 Tax=Batillaria attramentaria TaxID=370345 RepID=A0ABD0LT08_9CAEN
MLRPSKNIKAADHRRPPSALHYNAASVSPSIIITSRFVSLPHPPHLSPSPPTNPFRRPRSAATRLSAELYHDSAVTTRLRQQGGRAAERRSKTAWSKSG